MGDSENAAPPSKKRVAGRELSRDNPGLDDEDESTEQETETFKRASDEVLANRRIVKVRRHQPPAAASSNPFAGIRLLPPTESSAKPAEVIPEAGEQNVSEGVDKTSDVGIETEKEPEITELKKEDENDKPSENKTDEPKAESDADKNKSDSVDEEHRPESGEEKKGVDGEETKKDAKEHNGQETTAHSPAGAPLSSFRQLSSSQNAFTSLIGTGFSSSSFSFGTIPKDGPVIGSGSGSGSAFGPLFGLKNDKPSSYPLSSFGSSNNGSPSVFSTAGPSSIKKNEGIGPSLQEVPVETGEENEKAVFTADAVLFEYLDGGWKERGKGEVKVNVSTTGTEKARLIMRARGNLRLILNASLYPDMKLTNMEKKGITFACINSTGEGKEGLSTFALKFKDGFIVEEFCGAVMVHKDKKTTVLKTPENSPKASDD
ncbi:nuclear pore complex protein NUP50A-like isoform X2 [Telopea speciosissima]|uniref:nuclear pore complex protein NUP50A-like isoform X2 n=1 Tax=Telopea speciosissima TaxID=54955 RepID=UPI001CC3AE63|nr:nuclear pore complex protein NUP50A-like isoform X2 [Telopea speciosissima]